MSILVWIRNALIILPAVITVLITDLMDYSFYICTLLSLLLLVRVIALIPSAAALLLPVEIVVHGIFAVSYGGVLYLTLLSSLIALFQHTRSGPYLLLLGALGWAALFTAVHGMEPAMQWSAHISWLSAAALLAAMRKVQSEGKRLESELLSLSRKQENLELTRRRIIIDARAVEQHAQAQERNRIAHELHDDLGHRLIRLKMMMEAGLQLLTADPVKGRSMMEQVRGQLEESMENMRRTVRRLRPVGSEQARQYALDRLIANAARDLQIEVFFRLEGRPFPLYPSLEYTLYCNAQEAITNAVRHGGANEVTVTLRYTADVIVMEVANNGRVPDSHAIRRGLGLRAMEERLALFGGRLEISCEPPFRILSVVPHREQTNYRAREEHTG
ncbi:sensor histidine kinase [Paenibacillus tarimensis]|uniref:sensor histidine kinase n=1 Tax=Paenibacillus tarimensis TaxID=416012 RepID=UPI001F32B225|nr:sensor histidine kinase [Paenibacillus tarimensis]MCF2942169.1 sensor histidine kinase [Paenibacillus tarimensis]